MSLCVTGWTGPLYLRFLNVIPFFNLWIIWASALKEHTTFRQEGEESFREESFISLESLVFLPLFVHRILCCLCCRLGQFIELTKFAHIPKADLQSFWRAFLWGALLYFTGCTIARNKGEQVSLALHSLRWVLYVVWTGSGEPRNIPNSLPCSLVFCLRRRRSHEDKSALDGQTDETSAEVIRTDSPEREREREFSCKKAR